MRVETPDVFETARPHLAFGSQLRRGRQRARSREQLRTAIEQFDYLGAVAWSALPGSSGPQRAQWVENAGLPQRDELTPQQLGGVGSPLRAAHLWP